MAFTIDDRRQTQLALGLPRWELENGSDLTLRLDGVVTFDAMWGTTIEADIKATLAEIAALNTQISESVSDRSAGAVQTRQTIDEYNDTLILGTTVASTYRTHRADLVARLRADLGYGLESGAFANGVTPVK